MNSDPFPRGIPTDLEILILWRMGMDIAKKMWVPEYHIANRLMHVREREHELRVGEVDGSGCEDAASLQADGLADAGYMRPFETVGEVHQRKVEKTN